MSVVTFIKMCVIATSEERSIQDDMTRNAEVSEDIVTKLAPNFELKLREELDFFDYHSLKLEDQLLEALA